MIDESTENIIEYRKPLLWQRGYDEASKVLEPQIAKLIQENEELRQHEFNRVWDKLEPDLVKLTDENDELYRTNSNLCDEVNKLLGENAELLKTLMILTQSVDQAFKNKAAVSTELALAFEVIERLGGYERND
jgi:succinate dehydrogenase flavin-adding protein (antitoxin of CptAB toxin-antitoxin module)